MSIALPRFESNIARYAIATVGPIGSAGAQFLLAFVLLHVLDPKGFGSFSFLLILSQFSWGVWSALFCAPLPILYQMTEGEREHRLAAMFAANLIGTGLAWILFAIVAFMLGEEPVSALLFAAYAALALLRWFARANAYAAGQPLRTTASDMLYTLVLLAGAATLPWAGEAALSVVWAALFAGVTIGLVPFGAEYLRRQFAGIRLSTAPAYAPTWNEHGRWALLGVLTTEATANAHAYLVTLLLGPTAFAPIAASALMIRPITVAMNALTEFERARMARAIGSNDMAAAFSAMRMFRWALALAWIGTVLATVILFAWNPHIVFPAKYPVQTMALATALWLLLAAVRLGRTPDSAMLQAAGAFRPLAFASIWSSVLSVVIVLALIALMGPVASIGGVVLGEILFALTIWKTLRAWLAERKS